MVDYSGCRSRNTRELFLGSSSHPRFFGNWSAPKALPRWNTSFSHKQGGAGKGLTLPV